MIAAAAIAAEKVTVGSKGFPESWILGDAVTALARAAGAEAEHRKNLGGTEIAYQALVTGSIDVYPEYTGTISEVILKAKEPPGEDRMRARLAERGLAMTKTLGFNDGYALATTASIARRDGLAKLSDLAAHPELRFGF